MVEYGLEWSALTSYFQMVELVSEPNTPQANQLRLYALDKSGVSTLYYKNDAGTVFDMSLAGANVAIGSTITSATAGSVFFAGTAGVLAQDNANFFWDDTNNDLLLGRTSHVVSSLAGRGFGVFRAASAEVGVYSASGADLTAAFRLSTFGGSLATPTATPTNVGAIVAFTSYGGSTFASPAIIRFATSQTQSETARGGFIELQTTPNGSVTRTSQFRVSEDGGIAIVDGITAPATLAGWGKIYIDTADGDLKIKYGDGTVKLIVTDTP